MTVHSGRRGVIPGITKVRSWNVTESYTENTAVHSGTDGGTDRENGIHEWSGTINCYGDEPVQMPGTYMSVALYKGPDSTGDEANGEILSGSIYINQVAITIDFSTNAIISHVLTFGGNGALSRSSGTRTAETTGSANETPCAGHVEVWDGATANRLRHITQATLTFSHGESTSVNSGDSAGASSCVTTRNPNGAIDWTLGLASEDGNYDATHLAIGATKWFRVYTTASTFYSLKWGKILNYSGINVDVEGGANISQTVNVAMKANDAGSQGHIITPSGTTEWGTT